MKKRVPRRLMAVLAADLAGYSRLMSADEEGTLAQLKAHRRELVDRSIKKKHRGHIIKTTGDGMLVEFASVVDAVQCAVEVQRAMVERNAGATLEHRIEFRVGINGGDIIEDEGDIFEDGVNIAARLESIAVRGAANLKQDIRHARPRRSQSAGGFWPRNSGWYTWRAFRKLTGQKSYCP